MGEEQNGTNIGRLHSFWGRGCGQEVKDIPGVGPRVGEVIWRECLHLAPARRVAKGFRWSGGKVPAGRVRPERGPGGENAEKRTRQ